MRARPSDVHPGGVLDNAVQPSREFRAPLELPEIPKCREEALLQNIFGVLRVPRHSSCRPRQSRHARGEQFVYFEVAHAGRQVSGWRNLTSGSGVFFASQETLVVWSKTRLGNNRLHARVGPFPNHNWIPADAPLPASETTGASNPLTSGEWASQSHSAAPRELVRGAGGAANSINSDTSTA